MKWPSEGYVLPGSIRIHGRYDITRTLYPAEWSVGKLMRESAFVEILLTLARGNGH